MLQGTDGIWNGQGQKKKVKKKIEFQNLEMKGKAERMAWAEKKKTRRMWELNN